MQEIWKDIPNYEGLYQVSNLGNIKSLSKIIERKNGYKLSIKERNIKKWLANNGYYMVSLWKNSKGKFITIHRLVAQAFLDNKTNLPCINHKDGNKLNNNINNLEWCSYGYNEKEAYKLKLKEPFWLNKKGKDNCNSKKINQYDLYGNFIKTWNSLSDITRELKIHTSNISKCCKGKLKKTGGYIWKYYN